MRGSIHIKVRNGGRHVEGGGSPMGNQLRGNEEMNGRQEFQAAGIQHQLQLQVEELAGVVRNLAQQVSQIKVGAGGRG